MTHIMTGAALGRDLRPWGAFVVGLASHLVLDVLPHQDHSSTWLGALDLLTGIFVARSFGILRHKGAFYGALGGAIPDLEVALAHFLGYDFPKVFPSHRGLLHDGGAGARGVVFELLLLATVLLALTPRSERA